MTNNYLKTLQHGEIVSIVFFNETDAAATQRARERGEATVAELNAPLGPGALLSARARLVAFKRCRGLHGITEVGEPASLLVSLPS